MNTHDVIVCVHNGKDDTLKCLEALVKNKSPKINGEVIIIDDASDNETYDQLCAFTERYEAIQLHRLPQQSFYTKAANTGLKISTAKYKTLLNSDTVVTKDWEERILNIFQSSSSIGIVGPLSNAASTQSVPHFKSTSRQTAINLLPPAVSPEEFSDFLFHALIDIAPPYVPLVHGFCMSIKADVIEKIGFLDEEMFPKGYGEENDFCFRADDAGFILAIAINAFIYHKKSVSYSNDLQRQEFMNNGMQKLVKKYGAKRIEYSVSYMEQNPALAKARNLVLNKWKNFYKE